jgi:UDPglucose 6-dehydrogenase
MRVAIFGTGYVGLVTGTCLAEVGHDVVCVDIDAAKVDGLNRGVIPIYEPGLEPMVKANHAAGRLHFTTNAAAAIAHGDIIFIAVGTPPDEDGSADLKYVLAVARTIGTHLSRPAVVVDKSTVPVGTADKVRTAIAAALAARNADIAFDVVSNPEFLKEGAAVEDCMRPDRIVIGADSVVAIEKLKRVYAPFNRNHDRIVAMDVRSAELTKYAANAMLATKISFMNEIANIAEQVGADVEMVRHGIGSDPRIGWHFIYPGAGYGGSCFPKDVQALAHTAQQHGYDAKLLNAVEAVNDAQKGHLFALIQRHYDLGEDEGVRGKTFAVWGLAFKPNTDDMREASSRRLLQQLWDAGAHVRAYDPEAMPETRRIFGERDDLVLCESAGSALEGCDALVVVTEWKQFRSPDFAKLKAAIGDAVVFDGRNLFDPARMRETGIEYFAIGRRG